MKKIFPFRHVTFTGLLSLILVFILFTSSSIEARVLAGSVTERKINRKIASMLKSARRNFDSGKVKPAIDQYWKILEIDPHETFAYLELGEIYVHLRIYDRAIELLEPGLSMAEREMDAETMCFYYCVLTRAHLALGQSGPANKSLIKAAQASPRNPMPREILGDIYLANNRVASAYKAYKKALEFDPDYAPAIEKLGSLVAEHGDRFAREELPTGRTASVKKTRRIELQETKSASNEDKLTEENATEPDDESNSGINDIEPMPMPMSPPRPKPEPAATKKPDERPMPMPSQNEVSNEDTEIDEPAIIAETAGAKEEKPVVITQVPDPVEPDSAAIDEQIDKLLVGSPQEKQAAISFFVQLKERGLNEVEELLYDSDPEVRILAIRALPAFSGYKQRVLNILKDAADDPDPTVKSEIERSMSSISD